MSWYEILKTPAQVIKGVLEGIDREEERRYKKEQRKQEKRKINLGSIRNYRPAKIMLRLRYKRK